MATGEENLQKHLELAIRQLKLLRAQDKTINPVCLLELLNELNEHAQALLHASFPPVVVT